jgi:flagellum-specific peptidoglycan hydrolase FlgJ
MTTPPSDVIAAAQNAERTWGIPASVSLAQWALESGWGKHMPPGSNNCFGMKARVGKGDKLVTVPTREVIGGRSVVVNAPFRVFATIADAFLAHGELLARAPVYAGARAHLPDAIAFAMALTGVYATDPKYGQLLLSIIRGSSMLQYDGKK